MPAGGDRALGIFHQGITLLPFVKYFKDTEKFKNYTQIPSIQEIDVFTEKKNPNTLHAFKHSPEDKSDPTD